MKMKLYNSLTNQKELFVPIDNEHIKMYVCGPTIYDLVHLGNTRPLIVYDVLVRLLSYHYPKISYIRNITDIDDKINSAAFKKGISIQEFTKKTYDSYQYDIQHLNLLNPTVEPRATDNISEMMNIIERLIVLGNAYEKENHVFFDVTSFDKYGNLSKIKTDEMLNGVRIENVTLKNNHNDFILWKPSSSYEPGWESPWGYGRPGWHIECSAMSHKFLGENFDIHGGGQDLIFPHHENEVAQSICSFPGSKFANYWIHNGMVLVDHTKMSKSLGNFITLRDILSKYDGEVIKFFMLKTHYRSAINYTDNAMIEAEKELRKLHKFIDNTELDNDIIPEEFLDELNDDLNTPKAIAVMHSYTKDILNGDTKAISKLRKAGNIFGIFKNSLTNSHKNSESNFIEDKIRERLEAKKQKDFKLADQIRNNLYYDFGIILEDKENTTTWRYP